MKILQVIPFFVPAWGFGGPVRVCYDISTNLVRDGHEVTVLTTDTYDQTTRIEKMEEKIAGISVFRFRNISNYLAKNFNLYSPRGFKNFFSSNVKEYDAVHLHAFFTYQNVVASRVCIKEKIPYVLHLHESPLPKKILGKVAIKKVFNFLFGNRILEGASSIFVLTSAEHDELAAEYPNLKNKLEIIPNGIVIENKKKNIEKSPIRKKYGFVPEDRIFLSLSRLAKIKRIDLIINAFFELQKDDRNAKLLIVGPDQNNTLFDLKNLSKNLKIQNKVIFMGPVEGDEKNDIYDLSDVYVLMSDYESFSMTCLEALEHNLPICLSQNVGVAKDILKFNCGIILSNTTDHKKSAAEMQDVYEKKANLGKICQQALLQFDLNTATNKIINIYKQLLTKRTD